MQKFINYPAERNGTADFMKGLAVILMIQVHLIELFAEQQIYNSSIGRISLFLGGPPAAPLFMVVMGYFLAASKKSFKEKIIRGIFLFIGGILLNIALNFNLLIKLYNGYFPLLDPYSYIFGVDILTLAGLSIIFITLLNRLLQDKFCVYFILATILVFLGTILPYYPSTGDSFIKYINAFFWGNYAWSYFPLLPWIAYPLTGYCFYLLRSREVLPNYSSKTKILFFVLWIVFIAFTIHRAIATSANLQEYYHHGILFFFWSVIFLGGVTFIVKRIENYLGKFKIIIYIKWVGLNVTVFYVVQWILIGNTATEIYKTQPLNTLLIWYLAIIVIVTALTIIWNRFFSKTVFAAIKKIKNYKFT